MNTLNSSIIIIIIIDDCNIHDYINNLVKRYPLSSRLLFRSTTFHSFEKYSSYPERDHKAWTFYRSSGFHGSSFAIREIWVEFYSTILPSIRFFLHRSDRSGC